MCFSLIPKFGEPSNTVINDEAPAFSQLRRGRRMTNDEGSSNAQMTKPIINAVFIIPISALLRH
jgi:hypothetical protein